MNRESSNPFAGDRAGGAWVDAPGRTEAAEPVRRTLEIEEATNLYFIHPIAARLVPLLAALRIPPNAVSIAGMLCGALAGVAYYHYDNPSYAITAFVLMVAWHILDGADGQLARLTHAQSASGKVLDGICDYVTFIAVYGALALSLSRQHGDGVWALVIVAGVCHAAQSAAYEMQRQEYNYWGLGRKSAEFVDLAAPAADATGSATGRLSDAIHRAYLWMQFLAADVTVEFQRTLTRVLQQQPERTEALRLQYRETFAPSVRRWAVMSANYRTIGIFVCAALGAPLAYFWFEIVGLSAIAILLLALRRRQYRAFFASLELPR